MTYDRYRVRKLFHVGQRVQSSILNLERMVDTRLRRGVVIGYSLDGGVRVRWDGAKSDESYHPDYIEVETHHKVVFNG